MEYADAVYHVTARGNERRATDRDEANLRKGLVLGGEPLWNKVRELGANAEEAAQAIELLIEEKQTAAWPLGCECAWAENE